MACNSSAYNLGVRNIILGSDRPQKFCILTKGDTAAATLNNKYFVFHEPVTQTKHYVWFDVAGAGVDPAVPNATGHDVELLALDSASAVATKTAAVLAALSAIFSSAVATGNEIECEFDDNGYAYEARDALATASKTKFNIVIKQFGSVVTDLGVTNGDTSFTIEEQTKEIKSPQTGDFVLAEIRRGATVSIGFELKDTSKDSIRRALNFYGSTYVTDDADSAVISGYGTSNLFKSTDDVADKLVLRSTDKAVDGDASEDFTVHKAKLKLGELTFSAENELVLPIEVVGYLDTSKAGFANLFSYGDGSKVS